MNEGNGVLLCLRARDVGAVLARTRELVRQFAEKPHGSPSTGTMKLFSAKSR